MNRDGDFLLVDDAASWPTKAKTDPVLEEANCVTFDVCNSAIRHARMMIPSCRA